MTCIDEPLSSQLACCGPANTNITQSSDLELDLDQNSARKQPRVTEMVNAKSNEKLHFSPELSEMFDY